MSAESFRGQNPTSSYSAAQHLERLPSSGDTQLLQLSRQDGSLDLALSQPAGVPTALGAGSPPSLVPATAVKLRSLPLEKSQQNSNIPRNVPPHPPNPKILLTPALLDEKQFSDEKWFSDESIQPIFTVRMSAWLWQCDPLLEGQPWSTDTLPSPPTTYRLGDCNSVHLPSKSGSGWTCSLSALGVSCAP